jgi:uncharacterized protein (DUF736 family)
MKGKVMATIGTLTATRDGGWSGPIFVLAREIKIKLVRNDNQANANSPEFRVFVGNAELGAMWRNKTNESESREYLGGEIDFPGLPEPISMAIFFAGDQAKARAYWSRKRRETGSED